MNDNHLSLFYDACISLKDSFPPCLLVLNIFHFFTIFHFLKVLSRQWRKTAPSFQQSYRWVLISDSFVFEFLQGCTLCFFYDGWISFIEQKRRSFLLNCIIICYMRHPIIRDISFYETFFPTYEKFLNLRHSSVFLEYRILLDLVYLNSSLYDYFSRYLAWADTVQVYVFIIT